MRSPRALVAFGILAALVAAAPQPKAHPLVGKWNIEYERGRRMTDGEAQSIMGKALLEVTARGDSLVGTLTPESPGDGRSAPPPSALAGTGTGNSADLKSSASSNVNINGETRTINISMTWALKAEGDNLSGTMTRHVPDMPGVASPAPVKGGRVK
jgi:hypothetical protein